MFTPFHEDPRTALLLQRAASGDREAAGELLELHRERLTRMVRLRLDPRVQGRMGVSDVLQEAYLEAARRLADYLRAPDMPFYLWLRFIAGQRVLMVHRRHLRVKARAAGREVRLEAAAGPAASSICVAAELAGRETSPTLAAARAELRDRLAEALESMEPIDREVLTLRHLEHLSNAEASRVLGIDPDAASKRYVRALRRMREALSGLGIRSDPGGPARG